MDPRDESPDPGRPGAGAATTPETLPEEAGPPLLPATPRAATRPLQMGWRRWVQSAAGIGLAVAIIAVVLPLVTGTSWRASWQAFTRVDPGYAALMFAVLLGAMWCYTYVLVGSLPGLANHKALILNLAGSSVANLLPFGGAVGVGITYGLCRSWGFTMSAISLSVVVSGLWNVMAKLALPAIGLAALALSGEGVARRIAVAAATGAAVFAVVILLVVLVLASERVALVVGRGAERCGEFALRLVRRPRRLSWDRAVIDLRHRTNHLVRTGSLKMTGGIVAYVAVYGVLFWMCLHAVGLRVSLAEMLAAYTLGRLLTSVVVTPGGIGISETGAAGLLVLLGTDPAGATAGVLLFAVYVHVLEIPLGLLGWGGWLMTRRWDTAHPGAIAARKARSSRSSASYGIQRTRGSLRNHDS